MWTLTLLVLAVTCLGSVPGAWPPFLRAGTDYPAPIASAIKRLWTDATFTRTVTTDPAPVPCRSICGSSTRPT